MTHRFHNLREAIELANSWESEVSIVSPANTELFDFIRMECAHFRDAQLRKAHYVMKFSERFLNRVCQSDVFMYANLLPKIPMREAIRDRTKYFLPIED